MNLLILFIILNIINVVLQTTKSILTIKCGKTIAALANAISYGFYTVVIIYMVCDLPLMAKVLIVAACNFVGVFVVKLIEEKSRKDKLWKIEFTVPTQDAERLDYILGDYPHSFIKLSPKHTIFTVYCETSEESSAIKKYIDIYDAKYFVTESKVL